ncbi:uncharacterized protein BJ171DRAFT_517136 [Polychytrium aggregatum]|uniref:uncharacterized protein n=1 Tax=Polychytrium aggregatum TaxID=110093 RepID=UPI0022FE48C3|nr:uncharacterized protein BJ171DRAFT_517136 [Polychytrium aggregatum]KAI9199817.1 hypothetical protein BJ171DRAFT_517136 [Polychytrium aggregatum]
MPSDSRASTTRQPTQPLAAMEILPQASIVKLIQERLYDQLNQYYQNRETQAFLSFQVVPGDAAAAATNASAQVQALDAHAAPSSVPVPVSVPAKFTVQYPTELDYSAFVLINLIQNNVAAARFILKRAQPAAVLEASANFQLATRLTVYFYRRELFRIYDDIRAHDADSDIVRLLLVEIEAVARGRAFKLLEQSYRSIRIEDAKKWLGYDSEDDFIAAVEERGWKLTGQFVEPAQPAADLAATDASQHHSLAAELKQMDSLVNYAVRLEN